MSLRQTAMPAFTHHFTRAHLAILLGFILVFSAFTAFALSSQSPDDRRENWNVAATSLTFLGPFTGAIARHLQDCCWKFSLGLFPFCAAFLLLGTVCQIVPLPFRRSPQVFRMGTWILGLLGWFLGAPVSFLHALS